MSRLYLFQYFSLTNTRSIAIFQRLDGIQAGDDTGDRTGGVMELFDVKSPNGLFQWVPLRIYLFLNDLGTIFPKSAGTGQQVEPVTGKQVGSNQVAKQVHSHLPTNRACSD
jgi:hypothetical protein